MIDARHAATLDINHMADITWIIVSFREKNIFEFHFVDNNDSITEAGIIVNQATVSGTARFVGDEYATPPVHESQKRR